MSDKFSFPYYRHLTVMECRKEILLQNEIINRKTQQSALSLKMRLNHKFRDNKLRLYYMIGFTAFFSMGFLHDAIFDSSLHAKISHYLTNPPPTKPLGALPNSPHAQALADALLKLERNHPQLQVTGQRLSRQIPQLQGLPEGPIEPNQLVQHCLKIDLDLEVLPSMISSLRFSS